MISGSCEVTSPVMCIDGPIRAFVSIGKLLGMPRLPQGAFRSRTLGFIPGVAAAEDARAQRFRQTRSRTHNLVIATRDRRSRSPGVRRIGRLVRTYKTKAREQMFAGSK